MKTKRIKVDVTQRDIKGGIRKSFKGCPIALALQRVTGYRSMVGNKCYVINAPNSRLKYKNSKQMVQFIKDFDDCNEVNPFSFYVGRSIGTALSKHSPY